MRTATALLTVSTLVLAACGGAEGERASGKAETLGENAPPPPAEGGAEVVATTARGRQLYADYCLMCHGETGAGDGPMASVMPAQPGDFADDWMYLDPTLSETGALAKLVKEGIPERGMPGYEGKVTDAEARLIAEHVQHLRSKRR